MSVLVTHLAPDFTKPAVLPDGTFNDAFNFHTEISGKYAVLFFIRSISPLSAPRKFSLTRTAPKSFVSET